MHPRSGLILGAIFALPPVGCSNPTPVTVGIQPDLAEICADDIDAPRGQSRQLLWLLRLFDTPAFDRAPVILTVHQVDERKEQSIFHFSAYSLTPTGLRRDVCVPIEGEYWNPPTLFSEGGEAFAFFETGSGGSATYRSYAVIHLDEDQARVLAIEHPVASLTHLMSDGRHSDPGRTWFGPGPGASSLQFAFAIWNPGEHNNFPSGGSVTGTMRVRRDQSGHPATLVVDTWEYLSSAAGQ